MIGPSSRSGRHVVRGRADQLHALGVRLVVGLGALEGRQERVVDVDHPALDPLAHLGREDLHVAGEHHELGLGLVDQRQQLGLGGGLGVGRHRDVVERHLVGLGQVAEDLVVGDDADDVDRERAGRPAEEQVVQAVPELRDHQQRLDPLGLVVQPPGHVERLGHPGEVALEVGDLAPRLRHREVHPHEEQAVVGLAVLLAGDDVGRVLHQEAGHRVDDAGLVRAGKGQDELPPAAILRAHIHHHSGRPSRASRGGDRVYFACLRRQMYVARRCDVTYPRSR